MHADAGGKRLVDCEETMIEPIIPDRFWPATKDSDDCKIERREDRFVTAIRIKADTREMAESKLRANIMYRAYDMAFCGAAYTVGPFEDMGDGWWIARRV